MSNTPSSRKQQIAELTAALKLPLPDAARREIEAKLRELQAASVSTGNRIAGDKVGGDKVSGGKVVEPRGSVTVSTDGYINGVAVGVNLGRIVYGHDPEEDERRRLVWYLSGLAARLAYLPLRGLEDRLDQGKGIALAQVYVMLATNSECDLARTFRSDRSTIYRFFERGTDGQVRPSHSIEYALPAEAVWGTYVRKAGGKDFWGSKDEGQWPQHVDLQPNDEIRITRRLLTTEAVHQQQQIVLLGDPGSGKSTFVRHLAWALAQRGLDQLSDTTALFGWNDQQRLLPVLLPLRTLAGELARSGVMDTRVFAALRGAAQLSYVGQVDDMLTEALRNGKILLLFDGLDEVPLEGSPDAVTRRATLEAIHAFIRLHPKARAVITCRTRAFDEDLRDLLGWPVETLAPFTLGQVRHFVPAWYGELVAKGQINTEQQARLSQSLINAVVSNPKLRTMAANPLLLTMMALVLYSKGELPRDRPQLYERILDLLLGQWDQVRDGQSLSEAIGLPEWGERAHLAFARSAFL